jgi:hypothetical protein
MLKEKLESELKTMQGQGSSCGSLIGSYEKGLGDTDMERRGSR